MKSFGLILQSNFSRFTNSAQQEEAFADAIQCVAYRWFFKTELKCEIRWIPKTVWISSAGTCPRLPDPHSSNRQWQLRQLIRAQSVRIQCSNIPAEE